MGLVVFEHERVTERGTATVTYRVRKQDGWLAIGRWPNAEVSPIESGPGTVWERRVALTVPVGTLIERVESKPEVPRKKDALQYLCAGKPMPPRSVLTTVFRAGSRGELERVPS